MAITRYFRQTRGGYGKRKRAARSTIRRFVRRRLLARRKVPRFKLSKYAGFPTKLKMRFRYCRGFKADTINNTGMTTMCTLTPNSLYLPDPSAGSHQPMWYDNMASIYQRYRVNFWKVKVTLSTNVINTQAVDLAPATLANNVYRVVISADDTGGDTSGSSTTNFELGRQKYQKNRVINSTTSSKLPVMTMTCRPWQMFARPHKDDTLAASFGASPSALTYCVIQIAPFLDETVTNLAVTGWVEIDMYATVFDIIDNQPQN